MPCVRVCVVGMTIRLSAGQVVVEQPCAQLCLPGALYGHALSLCSNERHVTRLNKAIAETKPYLLISHGAKIFHMNNMHGTPGAFQRPPFPTSPSYQSEINFSDRNQSTIARIETSRVYRPQGEAEGQGRKRPSTSSACVCVTVGFIIQE